MKKALALIGILLILAGIVVCTARHGGWHWTHHGTTTRNQALGELPSHRGVVLTTWKQSTQAHNQTLVAQIAASGANWIEIPCELIDSNALDSTALADITRLAHQKSINVCLEFRLPPSERNNLPTNEAEQDQWIGHVWGPRVLDAVKVVEPLKIDLICLGDHLVNIQQRDQAWIALIDAVRKNYKGALTYAADSDDYAYVTWWSSLDYIGVIGDFSLSDDPDPTPHALNSAWDAQLSTLESISTNYGKPALLLDVGYSSHPQVAHDPTLTDPGTASRPDIQEQCYQSALDGTRGKAWLAGIFVNPTPVAKKPGQDNLIPPPLREIFVHQWKH